MYAVYLYIYLYIKVLFNKVFNIYLFQSIANILSNLDKVQEHDNNKLFV